jgi:hypothetical protein
LAAPDKVSAGEMERFSQLILRGLATDEFHGIEPDIPMRVCAETVPRIIAT